MCSDGPTAGTQGSKIAPSPTTALVLKRRPRFNVVDSQEARGGGPEPENSTIQQWHLSLRSLMKFHLLQHHNCSHI
ncbi:hypothetical protein AMELA_G00108660, partial [Ameiurus melas]